MVACWNRRIPSRRIRVVNQYRYLLLRRALAEHAADEICLAIDEYAKGEWNRRKGAWKEFDHFLDEPYLTARIEAALNAQDKRRHAAPPADPGVRKLTAQVARHVDARQFGEGLRQRGAARRAGWAALPPARREELLRQARSDLAAVIPAGRITHTMAENRAMTLMEAGETADGPAR